VINPLLPDQAPASNIVDPATFWPRILKGRALQDCADLEKLLIGCEMIVALDDLDLLAA
jgi:hypothetical protein